MDKHIITPKILRSIWILTHSVILLPLFSANAEAGEIAGTPLVAYPAGGHNILLLHGNDSSMNSNLSGDGEHALTKTNAVKQAITALLTDTTTVSAKATASGQTIGIGLMTFGGSSSTSPYLWPLNRSPYTSYPTEIATYCSGFGDMFYLNASPSAHPYCLPRSIARPVSYKQANGSCSLTTVTNSFCYRNSQGNVVAASPAMGYLRVPIESSPSPSSSQATSRANLFTTAITNAGTTSGTAIEGALLTACDYFNSKWLDSNGGHKSRCYRGHAPGSVNATMPTNFFTDSLQGYTAQIPNTPIACDSSIVLIADNLQNTTADGILYTPDWTTTETNRGITDTSSPNYDPLTYYGLLTDPVMIGLFQLYANNKGSYIRTYAIGLGMSGTGATGTNMNRFAAYGFNSSRAKAYFPSDLTSLKSSLDSIYSNTIFTPSSILGSSVAAVTSNSMTQQTGTLIFQGLFSYNLGWFGDLKAYNYDFNTQTLGTQAWSASDKLNRSIAAPTGAGSGFDPSRRSIYTYNPSASTGIPFLWSSLNNSQQSALGGGSSGQNLLNWIRGAYNLESSKFRSRSGKILGSIVNSNPVAVSTEDFAYETLPEGSGTAAHPYQTFLAGKTSRNPMIYVGANDGMLHGFTIGNPSAYSNGGTEAVAYVPNALIGQTMIDYAALPQGGTYFPHVFAVDGSPTVADACLPDGPTCSNWKTILLGTTGAGGKAVFALDVTDPSSFSSTNPVQWEISDTDSRAYSPFSDDASRYIHGNLGHTVSQASIVRLNNGKWAAIVPNGYNSTNGHAGLFIFNLATGQLIRWLDTGVAGNTVVAKNGLSTPIAVDVDSNRTADYVYAGDLEGNVWKFDITCTDQNTCDASSWLVTKVFEACAGDTCTDANRQPITAKPEVGVASSQGQTGGVMIYVGTGKYFELGDNVVPASPQTQSFYAFWDNAAGAPLGRSNLVAQTIISQNETFRISSNNAVDYPSHLGWYMDLVSPSVGSLGERVVYNALVRNGTVLFETLIPNQPTSCTAGGTAWLMELDALTGWPVQGAAWASGVDNASGLKSTVGIASSPTVIRTGNGSDIRIYSGSTGGIQTSQGNSPASTQGRRTSWTQIQ